jgi:hypothetical protein
MSSGSTNSSSASGPTSASLARPVRQDLAGSVTAAARHGLGLQMIAKRTHAPDHAGTGILTQVQ